MVPASSALTINLHGSESTEQRDIVASRSTCLWLGAEWSGWRQGNGRVGRGGAFGLEVKSLVCREWQLPLLARRAMDRADLQVTWSTQRYSTILGVLTGTHASPIGLASCRPEPKTAGPHIYGCALRCEERGSARRCRRVACAPRCPRGDVKDEGQAGRAGLDYCRPLRNRMWLPSGGLGEREIRWNAELSCERDLVASQHGSIGRDQQDRHAASPACA